MTKTKTDIVIALNYYTPYVSGLTNVARDVAEGLALRGWRITVVAAQHASSLPREEVINGVRVVRTPVAIRLGKGVISPSFVKAVHRESVNSRIIHIHAPMLEAGPLALTAEATIVLTYHCDVSLAGGISSRLQNRIIDASTRLAAKRSRFVVVTTGDYADNSRVRDVLSTNRVVIPPTCQLRSGGHPKFRESLGVHIGFLGRIVEEKGIEYLIDGFRGLNDPSARLLLGGDFDGVAGGSVIQRIREHIKGDSRVRLLGFLSDSDVADFYASLDVFALPSVNPFEAFGIVQVEAMMLGIPVIASNLPGVRQPIKETGMGEIFQPRSSDAITAALRNIKKASIDIESGKLRANYLYSKDAVVSQYASLFEQALNVAPRR